MHCLQNTSLANPACERPFGNYLIGTTVQPRPQVDQSPGRALNRIGPHLAAHCYTQEITPKGRVVYRGTNPILIDAMRAQPLLLDRPHYSGEVPACHIYDKTLTRYGKDYLSYSTINAGELQYYTTPDLGHPYYEPVFTNPSVVYRTVRKDPMDVLRPEYDRDPQPMVEQGCDTRTRDALLHREDLMASQQRPAYESNYQFRWGTY